MPIWEFEADDAGVVVDGRTARITGKITDGAGPDPIPGKDAHTFAFDIFHLQAVMVDEDMTADEALEAALAKALRDFRRSSEFTAPDAPAPPTAIPGFAGRKIIGDPKAHREQAREGPPA